MFLSEAHQPEIRPFSLLIYLDATKFVLLSVSNLTGSYLKKWLMMFCSVRLTQSIVPIFGCQMDGISCWLWRSSKCQTPSIYKPHPSVFGYLNWMLLFCWSSYFCLSFWSIIYKITKIKRHPDWLRGVFEWEFNVSLRVCDIKMFCCACGNHASTNLTKGLSWKLNKFGAINKGQ